MDHAKFENIKHDMRIREGVEYLPSFWELILKTRRYVELTYEMERTLLAMEMNEFHRKCTENDRPGRRHMMPFVWKGDVWVPTKVGSIEYTRRMGIYRAKMAELTKRTPNYGRTIQQVAAGPTS